MCSSIHVVSLKCLLCGALTANGLFCASCSLLFWCGFWPTWEPSSMDSLCSSWVSAPGPPRASGNNEWMKLFCHSSAEVAYIHQLLLERQKNKQNIKLEIYVNFYERSWWKNKHRQLGNRRIAEVVKVNKSPLLWWHLPTTIIIIIIIINFICIACYIQSNAAQSA